MQAIVIGATGLVGTSLTQQLAANERFSSITTLARRTTFKDLDKVNHHLVDFAALESHADLLTGDVLFSSLGTTKKQAGSLDAQRVIDVDYQLKAADIAARNGVAHLVLVSSSGANAQSANPYLQMKGALEDAVKQLPFQRISILQPSLLKGPRVGTRPGEVAGQMIMPLFTWAPGLRKYRPIHCDVVAAKMISVALGQNQPLATYRLQEVFAP